MRNNNEDLNFVSLASFEQDLQNQNFPFSYVFIEPDYGEGGLPGNLADCDSNVQNDMHPGPGSDVRPGEALIKRVYDAIRASPIWNKSVLIVLFDEPGGFFDHVPPPPASKPNDGAVDNTHNYKFDYLGGRIPALIISPWVRYNVIDHTTYDHTSVLATVERLFDLPNLTERDLAANNFLEVFSQIRPRPDALAAAPPPHV
jgi:phospholipase C